MQHCIGCARANETHRNLAWHNYATDFLHRHICCGAHPVHRNTNVVFTLYRASSLFRSVNQCKTKMHEWRCSWCDFAKCHGDDGSFELLTNIHSSGLFSIARFSPRLDCRCLVGRPVLSYACPLDGRTAPQAGISWSFWRAPGTNVEAGRNVAALPVTLSK